MNTMDRWVLPEGVEELLPQQAARVEQMRRDVLDNFERWGYRLVIPPMIEFAESLLVGSGRDVDNQSFKLTDQISGRLMAARADITPQVARIDAHSVQRDGVSRFCYAGSVLNTKPKTLLASRCPIQVGAELFGDNSLNADIEVISLMLNTLQVAGIEKVTLDLGHVAIYSALLDYALADVEVRDEIFDALKRKSVPDVSDWVAQHVKEDGLAEMLQALPNLCGDRAVLSEAKKLIGAKCEKAIQAIEHLSTVADVIAERFPKVNIYFDLAELRGYDYHTGLVFAAFTPGFGQAIANGGRYNEIGAEYGRSRSATGFNADIKALIALSDITENDSKPVVLAPNNKSTLLWETVEKLRAQGIIVVYCDDFNDVADLYPEAKPLVESDGKWQVS